MENSETTVEKPEKPLLGYKGFIKVSVDSETEREAVGRGLSTHVMGEDEEEG